MRGKKERKKHRSHFEVSKETVREKGGKNFL